MRAHIIEGGVIANTLEVESLDFKPGLVAAQGSEGIGWLYDGSTFSPPPPTPPKVPDQVSPRQIKHALLLVPYGETTMRAAVEAAVAAGDQFLKDWWVESTYFERQNPMVLGMAAGLGVTEQQLNDLFTLAGTL